jgi:hypothetical protein
MAVIINGVSFGNGENVVIRNGKVIVDGYDRTPEGKTINIFIEGDVNKLEVDACDKIYINGNVNELDNTSGDVTVNEIRGNVSTTSGNVKCEGNCGGSVNTTSGNVKANEIKGSVKTMSGDIKTLKEPKDRYDVLGFGVGPKR